MATTETHSETSTEHGEKGLPQLNPEHFAGQLFWLAVLFLLLYFVMSRVTLPRIASVVEGRRDKIAGDIDTAAKFKREAEDAIKSYEKSLADARTRARGLAEENRRKVKAETDRQRESVEADLNKKLSAAEAQILATKAQALANVKSVAAETAQAIVSRLTGEAVELRDAEAAVQRVQGKG
jgi:F-type H+-transporting ATPase subunit b